MSIELLVGIVFVGLIVVLAINAFVNDLSHVW